MASHIIAIPVGMLLLLIVILLLDFKAIRFWYMRKRNRACVNCAYHFIGESGRWSSISSRCARTSLGYDPVKGCALGFQTCNETVGTIKCRWKKKEE